jgi:hypothetical protein
MKLLTIIFLAIIGGSVILQFVPDNYLIDSDRESFNQTINVEDMYDKTNEPHWGHMPLKYKLDEYCKTRWNGKMAEDIREGIKYVEENTPVTFIEVDSNEDILYDCNLESKKNRTSEDTLAEAELEYYQGIYSNGNLYHHGTVYFYNTYNCYGQRSTIWIHETLHLLGLHDERIYDKYEDIMWYQESDGEHCFQSGIVYEDQLYLDNIYGDGTIYIPNGST